MREAPTIRPAHSSDLDRIIEIEQASFTIDAFSSADFEYWLTTCPELFIVAEKSGVVAGNMITCILPQKGDIISIAVDPKNRQEGIGRMLVNFTLNELKRVALKIVELKVRPTNKGAIGFWESCGFFSIGVIPDFYRDGSEAIQMRRILEERE